MGVFTGWYIFITLFGILTIFLGVTMKQWTSDMGAIGMIAITIFSIASAVWFGNLTGHIDEQSDRITEYRISEGKWVDKVNNLELILSHTRENKDEDKKQLEKVMKENEALKNRIEKIKNMVQ